MKKKNRKSSKKGFFSSFLKGFKKILFFFKKILIKIFSNHILLATLLVFLSIFYFLSIFGQAGVLGEKIFDLTFKLIGEGIAVLPLALFLSGIALFFSPYKRKGIYIFLSFLLLIVGFSSFFKGGILGRSLFVLFQKTFGKILSETIFVFLFLLSFFIFYFLLKREKKEIPQEPSLIKRILIPTFKEKEVPPQKKVLKVEEVKEIKEKEKEILKIDYQSPPIEFLDSDKGKPSPGDIKENCLIIKKTLENFGIEVEMGEVFVGPTVTQYTLKPAEGIKLSKITSLTNDLALALASHPIRIEAPIPGKSLVGIEVPNKVRTLVRLRDLISLEEFQKSPSPLTFVVGRDVSGHPVFADLSQMPHLLVAGATGTGKTCAKDTLLFTEKGILTFEEIFPLPLNSEADFEIKVVTRDGIETTKKIYNNGICKFYKIKTSRGYQIEVTAEHPLWVMEEGGSQCWKPAALIKEGDYVAISRSPPLFGKKTDLSDFKPSEIKSYHKKIKFPKKMNEKLAQFLGFLTADGGLSIEKKGIHRVTYTQADPKLLSLYKKFLRELFGITQFIEKKAGSNPKNKAKEIVVNSKHLKEFLAFLGMSSSKSPQKEVPRAIREAPKEIVKAYLKALFDHDGYVDKEGIGICLSSEKLISQIQIILLNFGIISSVKRKLVKNYPENKYFKLSIYGEDARKFVKEIGFIRKEKYKKAKKLFKLSPNSNLDLIPHISSLLQRLSQKYLKSFAKLTNRGWQYQPGILIPKYAFSSLRSYGSGQRRPSYKALEKILNFYQPISKEPEYQNLKEISKRNFYWDKVEKITQSFGVGYDFYVPGSDSFVGNGFVNHNTIFLNSLILSLVYRNSPKILKFVLIDPKRVEFRNYQDLPHLIAPVIFDSEKVVSVLDWLVFEMERRFQILGRNSVRDIFSFNQKAISENETLMPYIVLIIDELADIMLAKGREVENRIVRLAQLARAVGIHLVLATQRPSVEVLTGLIKANITSRIAFQVASQFDSRTILDIAGAEKLLGKGDLLFISAQSPKPKRIQGAYVSEKEVKKIVNWFKEKGNLPNFDPDLLSTLKRIEEEKIEEGFFVEDDPLYEDAKKVVIQTKKASASLLQRRLKIGYARAARLIDLLEKRGVIGPPRGSKPREVLITEEEEKEESEEEWEKI